MTRTNAAKILRDLRAKAERMSMIEEQICGIEARHEEIVALQMAVEALETGG